MKTVFAERPRKELQVFRGVEIKKLLYISTVSCMIMLIVVSVYLILSSRHNLDIMTESMQEAMARQLGEHVLACSESLDDIARSEMTFEDTIGLEELLEDRERAYQFLISAIRAASDAEVAYLYVSDALEAVSTKEGYEEVSLPKNTFSSKEEEFLVIDSFGEKEGTFIAFQKPGFIPGQSVQLVLDNTKQIKYIDDSYNEKRTEMIREQIFFLIIIFLALLALSFVAILFSIKKFLSNPINKLAENARDIIAGKSIEEIEIKEKSAFKNLQMLLKSGHIIFQKASHGDIKPGLLRAQGRSRKEVNKVMVFWIVLNTSLFLFSATALLVTSIALLNGQMLKIKDNVTDTMIDFYSKAYDSDIEYVKTTPNLFLKEDFWNPELEMERDEDIRNMYGVLLASFNSDAVAFVHNVPDDPKIVEVRRPGAPLYDMNPDIEDIDIQRDVNYEGDLILTVKREASFPGYKGFQYAVCVIDLTEQANVLREVFDTGSSSLLVSQLLICLVFLFISAVIAPAGIAIAVQKNITKPIIELNSISEAVMEGHYDKTVSVDENSAFSDIQILLQDAQRLLNDMPEEQ